MSNTIHIDITAQRFVDDEDQEEVIGTLKATPKPVSVADDRDFVDGWAVEITLRGSHLVTSEVIPMEGPSFDCWAGTEIHNVLIDLDDETDEAISEALRHLAA